MSCTSHSPTRVVSQGMPGARTQLWLALPPAAAGWLLVTFTLLKICLAGAAAVEQPGPARSEDAVALLAAAGGLVTCLWLALAAGATILAALAPHRAIGGWAGAASRHLLPATLRHAATVALGCGLLGGHTVAGHVPAGGPAPAWPATGGAIVTLSHTMSPLDPGLSSLDPGWGAAVPTGSHAATSAAATSDAAASDVGLDPGWVPQAERPATQAGTAVTMPGPRLRPSENAETCVVVRRGDTLWDIAARHLGTSPTAAEIAAEWPRWYAVNHALIGDDPNLVHPGQRLTPPTGATSRSRPTVARPSGPAGTSDPRGGRR